MSQEWKIYTKTGDKGSTSLIGGQRVSKYDERIEAYGTVDELNSYLGLIQCQDIETKLKDDLLQIQNKLFAICTLLSIDDNNVKFNFMCLFIIFPNLQFSYSIFCCKLSF